MTRLKFKKSFRDIHLETAPLLERFRLFTDSLNHYNTSRDGSRTSTASKMEFFVSQRTLFYVMALDDVLLNVLFIH